MLLSVWGFSRQNKAGREMSVLDFNTQSRVNTEHLSPEEAAQVPPLHCLTHKNCE